MEAQIVLFEILLFRVSSNCEALTLSPLYHCFDSFHKRSFNTESPQFIRLIVTDIFANLFL